VSEIQQEQKERTKTAPLLLTHYDSPAAAPPIADALLSNFGLLFGWNTDTGISDFKRQFLAMPSGS